MLGGGFGGFGGGGGGMFNNNTSVIDFIIRFISDLPSWF